MELEPIKITYSKETLTEGDKIFQKIAKKEIAEQKSIFSGKKAAGKQKSVEYFGMERTEIIKDADGNELYTVRTNPDSKAKYYQYTDSKNDRYVCFIDKDDDGNMDEVEIVNASSEELNLKKGTPWLIIGYDEDDDGAFDAACGRLAKEKGQEKIKLQK